MLFVLLFFVTQGSNLDSVPLSEYRVTVGGEPCEIVSINEEGTQVL